MSIKTTIATINDVRQFITVDTSADITIIQPYIYQAENKYIKELIGSDLLEALRTYVENDRLPQDDDLDNLLDKVHYPLLHYAYRFGSDRMNIELSGSGYGVIKSENLLPASKDRTDALKAELELAADDGAEDLLEFLEANRATYPDWETSPAYSFQKKYFINNAEDIKKETGSEYRRMNFIKYRADLNLFEKDHVEATTCTPLFDRLKTVIKDGGGSAEELILINDYIIPACSWYMLYKSMDHMKYKERAIKELNALRIYLNDNVTDYPLFENSTCYEADVTPIFLRDQNDEDSPIFLM